MDFSHPFFAHQGPASNSPTSLAAVPTASARGQAERRLASPENPLFAFAALAAVTFGLMAFSTSVRVGHAKAALDVGSTS